MPAYPVGYDKVRSGRYKEQDEVFIMGIICEPVQEL